MQIEGSLEAWVEGQTVTRWLRDGVRERGDRVALRARGAEGAWQDVTWAQVGDGSARVAGGLQRLGVGAGDTVLLMLRNRPEFHIADLGALLLRAIPVSIYNTSAPEQIAYLARHCGAKVAIVDDLGFLARILEVRDELPDLRAGRGGRPTPRASPRSACCHSPTSSPRSDRPGRCRGGRRPG